MYRCVKLLLSKGTRKEKRKKGLCQPIFINKKNPSTMIVKSMFSVQRKYFAIALNAFWSPKVKNYKKY